MTSKQVLTLQKGQKLLYIPKHGPVEEGLYSSHNDLYIFLKFPESPQGVACRYEDVDFLFNYDETKT